MQVNVRLRKMVEAQCPEAVGRRRAEEVKALATAELLQLVPRHPPTESHQALVQVRRVLPNRVRFATTDRHTRERRGEVKVTGAVGGSG